MRPSRRKGERLRVLVHAPADDRLADGLRARAHETIIDSGAALDRLIGASEPPSTALAIFTDAFASLMVPEGEALVLPRADLPVIGFLRSIQSLPRSVRMGAAVLSCGGFDRVAVMAASSAEAELGARMIGGTSPALDVRALNEEIWDRLSEAVRRGRTLASQGRIHAAVIALRGRGRIVGPVSPDLLIQFGVSAFR